MSFRLQGACAIWTMLLLSVCGVAAQTRAFAAPLPNVVVTGVAVNASSAKIDYEPVPGAQDYRVYDVANPTVVKYAGIVHLDAGTGAHFVLQPDAITPSFPYTSTANWHGGTGPRTLDVPSTEIEWNRLQDGRPHTLVVQAVDALGPVPAGNLTDVGNLAVFPPADRPGIGEGPTRDGYVSINGQGPITSTPHVLAQSGAFVAQANPALRPIPSRPDATQAFLDTFDDAEAASLVQAGSVVNAFGSPNAITYTLNAGTAKASDLLFQGVDTTVTRPSIVAGQYQDALFDGQTTSTLTRFTQPFSHTLYASSSLSPRTPADLSSGKMLHLTEEVDRHLDRTNRWLSFELAPATEPLTSFRADDSVFGGNAATANAAPVSASNRALWVQVMAGSCDATLLEGSRSPTDNRPLVNNFVPLSSAITGTYPLCYQPLNWGDNGLGLDNRSRLDLFVTTRHLALFEDGTLLMQADIPDGGLPFTSARAYFTHYLYNTLGENQRLRIAAPYETNWLNNFAYSDERHWDNMGLEVLPAAAVPVTNDFGSLASLIHLPVIKAPALVIPATPSPTPSPSVTSTPLPTGAPAAYSAQYASVRAALSDFQGQLNAQPSPQPNRPIFGTSLMLANSQRGTALLNANALVGVQLELDRMKALGIQAATLAVDYPLLVPSYPNSAQYLSFFKSVAQEATSRGMKLVIEQGVPLLTASGGGIYGFTYPAFCTFEHDMQQMTQSIIDNLSPYYLTVLHEPSTLYDATHYTQLAPSGGTQTTMNYLNYILGNAADPSCPANPVAPLRKGSTKIGAGQGNWDSPDYAQGYAQIANLDTIDLHVYPIVNTTQHPFMQNILAIASYARQAGKKLGITEMWDNKEAESDFSTSIVTSSPAIFKRDSFSFWQPTDQLFLTEMVQFARTNPVDYISPFWSLYFEAYLPYTPGVYDENTSAYTLSTQLQQVQLANMQNAGPYTQVGLFYQSVIASSVGGPLPLASAVPPSASPVATPSPTRIPASATATSTPATPTVPPTTTSTTTPTAAPTTPPATTTPAATPAPPATASSTSTTPAAPTLPPATATIPATSTVPPATASATASSTTLPTTPTSLPTNIPTAQPQATATLLLRTATPSVPTVTSGKTVAGQTSASPTATRTRPVPVPGLPRTGFGGLEADDGASAWLASGMLLLIVLALTLALTRRSRGGQRR